MSASIIDGTRIAQEVRAEVAQGVQELQARHGVTPGLAAVLVGDNPASAIYVRNKRRACYEVGISSETFNLPQETTQEELLGLVRQLNSSGHNAATARKNATPVKNGRNSPRA